MTRAILCRRGSPPPLKPSREKPEGKCDVPVEYGDCLWPKEGPNLCCFRAPNTAESELTKVCYGGSARCIELVEISRGRDGDQPVGEVDAVVQVEVGDVADLDLARKCVRPKQ